MPFLSGDDVRRTARLLLDAELVSGRLLDDEVVAPHVLAAVNRWRSNLLRNRLTATVSMRLGWADGIAANIGRSLAVRQAALGGDAYADPRFLVRVDEFPSAGSSYFPDRYGIDAFQQFHDVLAGGGNPYLLGVVPELADDYLESDSSDTRDLSDDEIAVLQDLPAEIVLAQHGTTHRTRYRSPRRRSEFGGLASTELTALIDRGRRKLEDAGIYPLPRILIPPFNRFDRAHWHVLAERFDVIAGGPESVPIMGAQPGPVWRSGAVYVPSYRPLYGRAGTMISAVERLIDSRAGTWVPIVLHTSWEANDDFRGLARLAELIRPYTVSWLQLLSAVDRSSAATTMSATGGEDSNG